MGRVLVLAKVPVALKWPNDVLAAEAKISGILVEQVDDAVIIGVGLNILEAPSVTGYRTTTVAAQGGIATVDGARDKLLERFRRLLDLWTDKGRTDPGGVAGAVPSDRIGDQVHRRQRPDNGALWRAGCGWSLAAGHGRRADEVSGGGCERLKRLYGTAAPART